MRDLPPQKFTFRRKPRTTESLQGTVGVAVCSSICPKRKQSRKKFFICFSERNTSGSLPNVHLWHVSCVKTTALWLTIPQIGGEGDKAVKWRNADGALKPGGPDCGRRSDGVRGIEGRWGFRSSLHCSIHFITPHSLPGMQNPDANVS